VRSAWTGSSDSLISGARSASSRGSRGWPRPKGTTPRIELEWGRAAFTTWTHNAAGLTRNDFILAAKIDRIAGV
jgi:hypothetical protein